MPQDAREVTMAYWEQSSLSGLPSTWDTDGNVVEFLAIDPNWSGVKTGVIDNRNMRRRAYATYPALIALPEPTFTMGMYASGSGATTANSSAASTFALAEMLRNAWCGQHLGYASAVVTPSASAPDITVGQGANHPAGAAIFGMDSSSVGQFAIVDNVSTDVLNLRTETDNAIATVGAAIACFPNTRGLGDRTHSSHVTHAIHFRGEDTDDNYEVLGVKFNVTGLENSEAGGDASFTFEAIAYDHNDATLSKFNLTGTPQGPAPPIVGHQGTAVRIANVGTAALTDVGAYSISFTPGISYQRVPGMATNGMLGHKGGGYDETMLEVVVPFDDAWITDFENRQQKHVMVQVGYQRGDAWGIYLPNADIAENPERGVSADETSMTLKFRANEFAGTTHTEGTNNYELERAKFLFLMAA